MTRMAVAAKEGIRAKAVNLPIIGIHKVDYADSDVYITPTMKEVDALINVGPDIIAVDATKRIRPNGQTLEEFFQEIKRKYPNQMLMADTSCYEEG